jgi:hypothetical protein
MSAVELRPLGIGEILDVAIKIYLRHFSTFLKIALVIVLPTQVIVNAIVASNGSDTIGGGAFNFHIQTNPDGTADTPSAAVIGGAIAAGLIAWLAGTIATGASFKAVADGYLGTTPDWRGSLRAAGRRLGSLIWIALLVGIVTVLLAILCIAPGVWFAVGATIAVPVLFTEDKRGWDAISRSRELVKGRWWPTFGLIVIGAILGSVLTFVLQAILGGVADSDAAWPVRFLIGVLIGTATALVTTPFSAAYHTILYVDLRVRKEGFDLALFAHRMGAAPDPAAAPAWGFAGPEAATQPPAIPPTQQIPPTSWEPGEGGPPPLRPPGEPPPGQ